MIRIEFETAIIDNKKDYNEKELLNYVKNKKYIDRSVF